LRIHFTERYSVRKRQQRVDVAVRAGWQAIQGACQPRSRIEAVEFRGGDQRLNRRGAAAGPLGSGEQPVLLADRDGPDRIFDRIVIDGQIARSGIAAQRLPTCPNSDIDSLLPFPDAIPF
jgi:hypothetical protein